jgi:hypothetical protein
MDARHCPLMTQSGHRHPTEEFSHLKRPPIEAASGTVQDDGLAHGRTATGRVTQSFGPLAGDACRAAWVRTPMTPIGSCNTNCTARMTNAGLCLVNRQQNA